MVSACDVEARGSSATFEHSQASLYINYDASVSDLRPRFLLAWLIAFCFDRDSALPYITFETASQLNDAKTQEVVPSTIIDLPPNASLASCLKDLEQKLSPSHQSSTLPVPKTIVFYESTVDHDQAKSSWTYQLQISPDPRCASMSLVSQSRNPALTPQASDRRLQAFSNVLSDILNAYTTSTVISSIRARSADLDLVWNWNKIVPQTATRCMHDVISEKAKAWPSSVAIESWDGNWTYAEVDSLSTRLAFILLQNGVRSGDVIPLCFEKCKWTIIAVLAVMKSGAAFSLTDPTQPEGRLRTIVEQTHAKQIIVSYQQAELGVKISKNAKVIVLDTALLLAPSLSMATLPKVPPTTPMYVIFTSGSTGKPKGVIVSHENYASGALPRINQINYQSSSRVFDFASYAFDVSIDCMICTLSAGGCLCIPTDAERMNDLSGAIRKAHANMAHMTPSVARVLDPDIIPSLDVLGLGGEAISPSDAASWSEHASIIIAYGPSECTVGCTINNTVSADCTNLGYGVGGVMWIVDANDHEQLMPVGEVGELVVEGPVVGLGYLNEPEKTAHVFIDAPGWLKRGYKGVQGRHGKLYKTGDLVKYDPSNNGSIVFVGRKDQQVKLRGQRVELAEVEFHLRKAMPQGIKLAAEVIKPGGTDPILVAFLESKVDTTNASPPPKSSSALAPLFSGFTALVSQAIIDVDKNMGVDVPRYMVPATFIPLYNLPSLVSGKIDRKKLREIGGNMTRDQLASLRVSRTNISSQEISVEAAPETAMEEKLLILWKTLLGPKVKVSLYDNFMSLGGDSLKAMKLVGLARENGIQLNISTIFQYPTLKEMASHAQFAADNAPEKKEVPPFSLLSPGLDVASAQLQASELCGIPMHEIADIYPCSPLQEGLMALTAKFRDAFVAQRVVELESDEVAARVVSAFNEATKSSDILRTRIVQLPSEGLVQVVLKGEVEWTLSTTQLHEYLSLDRDDHMDLGKALVRYAIITNNGRKYFVLSMHHALYDGWSMPLVIDRINRAYDGLDTTRPSSFKDFIAYLRGIDRSSSEQFWKGRLDGATGPQFPALPYPSYQVQSDCLLEQYVTLGNRLPTITTATVVRGAWALIASRYSGSSDVVLGETLTGRNAHIDGVEDIEGPMITTVPVRIQVQLQASVMDYLSSIQAAATEQIPHEHFGLQNIRRVSPDALQACELRTGLVMHPSIGDASEVDASRSLYPANRLMPASESEAARESLKFNTFSLMLVCSLDPEGFLVMASFDQKTVCSKVLARALRQFSHVAKQMVECSDKSLEDIQFLMDEDISELSSLSKTAASTIASAYPNVEAAWVVDPTDSSRLLALGGVGELVVQISSGLSENMEGFGAAQLKQINTPQSILSLSPEAAKTVYETGKLATIDEKGQIVLKGNKNQSSISAMLPKTVSKSKSVSVTSYKQLKLRKLWAGVLGMPEDKISLGDSFFQLGGDSITAMKLVSEARLSGITLTVAKMFQSRTLYDMANAMEELQANETRSKATIPFVLIPKEDLGEIKASAQQSLRGSQHSNITDIIPARPLQEIAVDGTVHFPRFSARYEMMYFDRPLDTNKMAISCNELVRRNEILRTVFFRDAKKKCYGAVLDKIDVPILYHDVDEQFDLKDFCHDLCKIDVRSPMPHGSSFVKWFLIQAYNTDGEQTKSALIFRVSHAQYDEICLPLLLRELAALYQNQPTPQLLPFSAFANHVIRTIPDSMPYWRDLLRGSEPTVLRPDTPLVRRNHYCIEREYDISGRPAEITTASIPTAAWALCLARMLGKRDVVFGEVVSGRNTAFPHADTVVGPTWQYVPTRIKFTPSMTALDLLQLVQDQHMATSAHEGVGITELTRDGCWPASAEWFDTVVHQDVEHVDSLGLVNGLGGRTETLYLHEEPLREWKIQAFPKGNKMVIEVVTFESWKETAAELLDHMQDIFARLLGQATGPLFPEDLTATSDPKHLGEIPSATDTAVRSHSPTTPDSETSSQYDGPPTPSNEYDQPPIRIHVPQDSISPISIKTAPSDCSPADTPPIMASVPKVNGNTPDIAHGLSAAQSSLIHALERKLAQYDEVNRELRERVEKAEAAMEEMRMEFEVLKAKLT
ncbi:Nonribosomal peptide synthetase 4 [Ceratocystis lukuohia]|uniref:Nonribosomal peptide synthetase 4 n=1 Tax=Ceratocystis lukuohia TaxID=2019550 RepID=A0ABR4MEA5_9PEZI